MRSGAVLLAVAAAVLLLAVPAPFYEMDGAGDALQRLAALALTPEVRAHYEEIGVLAVLGGLVLFQILFVLRRRSRRRSARLGEAPQTRAAAAAPPGAAVDRAAPSNPREAPAAAGSEDPGRVAGRGTPAPGGGGEAAFADDDPPAQEGGPVEEEAPPDAPDAPDGARPSAAAREELRAIRERLLRIEDMSSPAEASGGAQPSSAEGAPAAAAEDDPPVSAHRAASRTDDLQETRRRIREALRREGAAIVDLRGLEAAPPPASNVHRDVERVARVLQRFTSSPRLPDGALVDVDACIDAAVGSTRAEAAAVVERSPRPVPGIPGSKNDVCLLLAELIENSVLAVEAQNERPRTIKLHASRRSGEVLVTVVDNGVGIPADARAAVFHPFHTSRHGAVGVGLTLARCLAKKHEGAITVSSSLHHGTVVRVTLPLERIVS